LKKAKEYAERLIKHSDSIESAQKEAIEVVSEMILEIQEMAKIRNIQSNSALISIVKEQERKWFSICNKVNAYIPEYILARDGFIKALKKTLPMTERLLSQ
jgi:predicted transcriptional regulator